MTTMTSWDAALAAPAPRDHLVQLYTSEPSLVSTLARFVEHGFRLDHGIVAITTAARWSAVAARLSAAGIDVAAAQSRGQLAVLDAADTLARLLVDGAPDRDATRRAIVPAIQAARAAGYTTVRAYGEMVDLLSRRGDLAAALRLEARGPPPPPRRLIAAGDQSPGRRAFNSQSMIALPSEASAGAAAVSRLAGGGALTPGGGTGAGAG
jgi:hypothetical protein